MIDEGGPCEVKLRMLSGQCFGPLNLHGTNSVSDLRASARVAMGDADDDSVALQFALEGRPLNDDSCTLMDAGVQTGVVLEVTRVPMIKVFAISEWTSTSIPHFGGGWPILHALNVPRGLAQDVAAAAVQQLATTESSHPQRLCVTGAGLDLVNGIYVLTSAKPLCWKKQSHEDVYLRVGSDGAWCLVNNPDGVPVGEMAKEYYYVSYESTACAPAWQADTHGIAPAPLVHVDVVVPCLIQVSTAAVRVLDNAEDPPEISSCKSLPHRFRVSNAGSQVVNGTYERHGENPLWVNTRNYEVFLRKGSDGNWCLVNNRGNPTDKEKKYYYVNRNAEVTAEAWRQDTHGQDPPPSIAEDHCSGYEQLFQALYHSGPSWGSCGGCALVATPAIPTGCRPLVLTIEHFRSEAKVTIVAGEVDHMSFGGLDDECIDYILHGPSGDFWRYLGK